MAEPQTSRKLPPAAERMIREVGEREAQIERGRSGKKNILSSIAILGVVGWSITVPTVVGVVIGVWIDQRWPSRFHWTLMLLFAGLAIGCINAWLRIEKERK
jgi:ATP synthase protein I